MQRRAPIRSFVVRPDRVGPGQHRALAELGPRIVQHEAAKVLQRMIAPGSLAGVHVWFPGA